MHETDYKEFVIIYDEKSKAYHGYVWDWGTKF